MQHVVPNNVARCCVEMFQAFGQALNHPTELDKMKISMFAKLGSPIFLRVDSDVVYSRGDNLARSFWFCLVRYSKRCHKDDGEGNNMHIFTYNEHKQCFLHVPNALLVRFSL